MMVMRIDVLVKMNDRHHIERKYANKHKLLELVRYTKLATYKEREKVIKVIFVFFMFLLKLLKFKSKGV